MEVLQTYYDNSEDRNLSALVLRLALCGRKRNVLGSCNMPPSILASTFPPPNHLAVAAPLNN